HQALTVGAVVLLLTGLVALAVSTFLVGGALRREEQARKGRALAQVEALLNADPRAVPALLEGLGANPGDVLPRLRGLWAAGDGVAPRVGGCVGRALLPVEAAQVKGWLSGWLLLAGDPPEVLLVRDGLRPYRAELVPDLWRRADDPAAAPEVRFRALVA